MPEIVTSLDAFRATLVSELEGYTIPSKWQRNSVTTLRETAPGPELTLNGRKSDHLTFALNLEEGSHLAQWGGHDHIEVDAIVQVAFRLQTGDTARVTDEAAMRDLCGWLAFKLTDTDSSTGRAALLDEAPTFDVIAMGKGSADWGVGAFRLTCHVFVDRSLAVVA